MFKTAENLLFSLGVLLLMLVALYGVSSLLIKFAPAPLSQWLSGIVQRSTPGGWAIGSSNS